MRRIARFFTSSDDGLRCPAAAGYRIADAAGGYVRNRCAIRHTGSNRDTGAVAALIAAQNSAGRYQRELVYGQNGYGDGGVVARYLDFSQATEQIVGEPLEVENANVSLYADEEALYWIWSGMVTDTPVLLRSNLTAATGFRCMSFHRGLRLPSGITGWPVTVRHFISATAISPKNRRFPMPMNWSGWTPKHRHSKH